jgi:hypothetical protein
MGRNGSKTLLIDLPNSYLMQTSRSIIKTPVGLEEFIFTNIFIPSTAREQKDDSFRKSAAVHRRQNNQERHRCRCAEETRKHRGGLKIMKYAILSAPKI